VLLKNGSTVDVNGCEFNFKRAGGTPAVRGRANHGGALLARVAARLVHDTTTAKSNERDPSAVRRVRDDGIFIVAACGRFVDLDLGGDYHLRAGVEFIS
jgi:hypothetical protein